MPSVSDTELEAIRFAKAVAEQLRMIEEYGWSMVGVFGGGPEHADWGYTCRLWLYDHPEIVINAVPGNVAHWLVTPFATQIANGRNRWRAGDRVTLEEAAPLKDGQRPTAVFIPVDDPTDDDYPLSMANYIAPMDVEALQLVLPDDHNRLPWDDGYDTKKMSGQILRSAWTPTTNQAGE